MPILQLCLECLLLCFVIRAFVVRAHEVNVIQAHGLKTGSPGPGAKTL